MDEDKNKNLTVLIFEKVCNIEKFMDKIDKTVYTGNGVPGIVSRVATLEKNESDCPITEIYADYKKRYKTVGIFSGIGIIIGAIIGILTRFFVR